MLDYSESWPDFLFILVCVSLKKKIIMCREIVSLLLVCLSLRSFLGSGWNFMHVLTLFVMLWIRPVEIGECPHIVVSVQPYIYSTIEFSRPAQFGDIQPVPWTICGLLGAEKETFCNRVNIQNIQLYLLSLLFSVEIGTVHWSKLYSLSNLCFKLSPTNNLVKVCGETVVCKNKKKGKFTIDWTTINSNLEIK